MTKQVTERAMTEKRALTVARRREIIRRGRRQQKIVLALMIVGMLGVVGGMVIYGDSTSRPATWIAVQKNRALMQREAALVCGLVLQREADVLAGKKGWLGVLSDVKSDVLRRKGEYVAAGYEPVYLLFAFRDLQQYAHGCMGRDAEFGLLLRGYVGEIDVSAGHGPAVQNRVAMAARYIAIGRQLYEKENQRER